MKQKLDLTSVEAYLKSTFEPKDKYQTRDRIVCESGLSVSVQGGTEFHYCSPRLHINSYRAVELGYPSKKVDEWMEYAEEPERPTETVYGWVPIAVVEAVVEANGGIKRTGPDDQEAK